MSYYNTHDLSSKSWGNNYNVLSIEEKGLTINLTGWCKGVVVGDYIIIKNGSDTTRYQIRNINYESDPADMFFATARFAPRNE